MVSGFFTSPLDHMRTWSCVARPIRSSSKLFTSSIQLSSKSTLRSLCAGDAVCTVPHVLLPRRSRSARPSRARPLGGEPAGAAGGGRRPPPAAVHPRAAIPLSPTDGELVAVTFGAGQVDAQFLGGAEGVVVGVA